MPANVKGSYSPRFGSQNSASKPTPTAEPDRVGHYDKSGGAKPSPSDQNERENLKGMK